MAAYIMWEVIVIFNLFGRGVHGTTDKISLANNQR
jgi:hypothetical protein